MAYVVRLWRCRRTIFEDVRSQDVLPYFLQEGLLSEDEGEIIMHEVTTRGRTMVLFRFLLDRLEQEGEPVFDIILWALRETSPHVAELLEAEPEGQADAEDVEAIHKFIGRTFKPHDAHIEDSASIRLVSSELANQYHHTCRWVTPVPWNPAFRMPSDQMATSLMFVSLSQAKLRTSKSLQEMAKNPCDPGVNLDDLFDKWTAERSCHVIIEGNPGTGKSTLCQKLAYMWTLGKSESPLNKRFDMVFLIEGRHMRRRLLDAVYDVTLPDNFMVTKSRLHEILEKPDVQEKTLFIIDAYDEIPSPHGDAMKLIRRKLYSRCTLLVTSRPNYTDEIIRNFDAGYLLLGLPYSQCKEFIHRYAELTKMPRSRYRDLEDSLHDNNEIAELSKTPLYLWFLCMLLEDRGDSIPKQRTELYREVVDFLLRKVEFTGRISTSVTGSFLDRMSKMAFATISEDRVDLDGYSEKVSQVGRGNVDLQRIFLTRIPSRSKLKPNAKYAFTHKSIQEFLAARHMLRMRNDERLRHIESHKHQRHWEMVWVFLSGLLAEDVPALEKLYRRAICRDLSKTAWGKTSGMEEEMGHSRYHLGLQCLAESGASFPAFNELSHLIMPAAFVYRVMTCHFCLQGWVRGHEEETPRVAPDLIVPSIDIQTYQRYDTRLLKALKQNKHMEGLVFSEVFSISMVTEYITKFCSSRAPMKRLYIYLSADMHPEVKESNQEVSRLRALHRNLTSLKSVVFIGSKSRLLKGAELTAQGIELLLASLCWNTGAPLETLVLVEHSLSDVTGLTLTAAMRHCSKLTTCIFRRIRMHPSSLSRFLTVVADLTCLRHLALDHCDLTAAAADLALARRICLIVSKCKITTFSLQGASERNFHLTHILRSLKDNRNITKLDLSECIITDAAWAAFAEILPTTVVQTLVLRSLGRLPDQFIASLRNVLSLNELDFSGNDFGDDSIFSRLCISLATQDHITQIHLDRCNLNDSHLPSISILVLSGHIHMLSLVNNMLGEIEPAMKAIHDLFNRCNSIHVLKLTLCYIDVAVAAKLGSILVQHPKLREFALSCTPTQELMSREAFGAIFTAIRERLPARIAFSLVFIQDPKEPPVLEHEYWRKLCLESAPKEEAVAE